MVFTQKEVVRVRCQPERFFFETKKLVIHLFYYPIYNPGGRSTVSFGAGIGKGLADHFDKGSLVYANVFAATALYLLIPGCKVIFFDYSCLMTAQNLTRTDLVIFPEFIFTGSTTDN